MSEKFPTVTPSYGMAATEPTKMHLWHLEITDGNLNENPDYAYSFSDCSSECIVRAPNKLTARKVASEAIYGGDWWLDEKVSSCERLHVMGDQEVILEAKVR